MRKFYFPPKVPVMLQREPFVPPPTPAPKYSTADAKITLARVSLVRVSNDLGKRLLEGSTEYEELVELIDRNEAEKKKQPE